MYCSNCGKKLSDDDFFCSNCGTPVSRQGLFDDLNRFDKEADNEYDIALDETRLFNPELLKENEIKTNIEIPIIHFPEEETPQVSFNTDRTFENLKENEELFEQIDPDEKKEKVSIFNITTSFFRKFRKEKDFEVIDDTPQYIEDELENEYEEASINLKKVLLPVIIIGIIIGLVIGMIMVKPWYDNENKTTVQGNIVSISNLK